MTYKSNTKSKEELDARVPNNVGTDVYRRDAEQGDLALALNAARSNFMKLTDDEKHCAFVEYALAMQDREPDIVRMLCSEEVCRGVDLSGGMSVLKKEEAKALIKAVRAANARRFREGDDVDELMAEADAGYRLAYKEAKALRKPGQMIAAIDRRLGVRGISVGQGGVRVNVAVGAGGRADVSGIPANQMNDTIVWAGKEIEAGRAAGLLPAGETVDGEIEEEE